jgi:DNA invertase Pin-like site-specific DNA recombinase
LDSLVNGMKVVTLSIDRIARDSEHLLNIKNTIHEKKCSMMILDRGIDTAKEESNLLIGMLAAVAEAERSNTKAKISSVMLDMSRRGALRGKPRFGYKIEDKNIVEDEEEQKIISIIRSLIEENNNITLTDICKRLTMENIVIRKSERIYPTTIKNIILANKLR